MRRIALLSALTMVAVVLGLQTPAQAADWPTVARGSAGLNVQAVQYLLGAAGHATEADGQFGPNTETRVREFQTDESLDVDGIVGPQSWGALTPTTRSGSDGDAVRATQVLLNKHGYGLVVDGAFGPRTEAAVESFQSSAGLSSDGVVGDATWRELAGRFGDSYTLPLPRHVLPRGEYNDPHHDYPAVDLPVGTGTDVFAVRGGTASIVNDSSCGRGVVISGTDGGRYVYCHLSSWATGSGYRVDAGQKIGDSGNTGNSTGPHLHFSVQVGSGARRCPGRLLVAIYDGDSVPSLSSLPTSGCTN